MAESSRPWWDLHAVEKACAREGAGLGSREAKLTGNGLRGSPKTMETLGGLEVTCSEASGLWLSQE